jgi:two-component system phosphate regulon sensor histidine kinase PhoR
MTDQAPSPVLSTVLRRWRGRLVGRGAILTVTAAALLIFVAVNRLDLLEACIAFAAIALAALFSPRNAELSALSLPEGGAAATRETAMRAFADALPDPCLILDRRSVVTYVNRAAAHEFSSTRAGDPIAFSLRHPALLSAIESARRSGEAQTVELHQTVPAESWHKLVVAPFAVADHRDDGGLLVLTMRSLTEEKRIGAMRTDFIANASHELRTPLTSLVGFIDTLLGPAANDAAARAKFLGIMRVQAARMSKLIEDLLSLSRIEMHQHLRPTSKTDLGVLLREVGEGLQLQAKEAGVAVSIDAPGDPVTITGDRDELYEVFENLIDNAIKYGGDGGSVEVVLKTADDRHGYDYAIEVIDHGAGIPAEHVPRLTERFYRVDAESSRKKKGTGLGLAIVKHILHRHRGNMSIRSLPGEGTRVEVLLPR